MTERKYTRLTTNESVVAEFDSRIQPYSHGGLGFNPKESGKFYGVQIEDVELSERGYKEELSRLLPHEFLIPRMEINQIEPLDWEESTDLYESSPCATWGIEDLALADCEYSGSGVPVAILDSGIYQRYLANGAAEEHNAFEGKVLYRDYEIAPHQVNSDTDGHGTHCAGIFFGNNVNNRRIGVASGVDQVYVGKIYDSSVSSEKLVLDGIIKANSFGAKIISLSFSLNIIGLISNQIKEGRYPDEAAKIALDQYRQFKSAFSALARYYLDIDRIDGRGSLIIAAAGNKGHLDEAFAMRAKLPSNLNNVISVGALSRAESNKFELWPGSHVYVDIVAPGSNIPSASISGKSNLTTKSGTSMAAPFVAGVAALYAEKNLLESKTDKINLLEVRNELERGAKRSLCNLGSQPEAWIGHGVVTAP